MHRGRIRKPIAGPKHEFHRQEDKEGKASDTDVCISNPKKGARREGDESERSHNGRRSKSTCRPKIGLDRTLLPTSTSPMSFANLDFARILDLFQNTVSAYNPLRNYAGGLSAPPMSNSYVA